jgi:hypothetical protein
MSRLRRGLELFKFFGSRLKPVDVAGHGCRERRIRVGTFAEAHGADIHDLQSRKARQHRCDVEDRSVLCVVHGAPGDKCLIHRIEELEWLSSNHIEADQRVAETQFASVLKYAELFDALDLAESGFMKQGSEHVGIEA